MISKLKILAKNKRHLVFDFDLTIAKMNIDWSEWHTGVKKIYNQFDKNHFYDISLNPHFFYNQMVEKHGDQLVEQMKKFNQEYENKYLTGITPNQELIDFIIDNKDQRQYVFSSNSRTTVENGLSSLGIIDQFIKIISRDDVRMVKPAPEGFYNLSKFAENKDQFLMIGDSSSDEEAAKTAGVDFLKCEYFSR